MNLLLSRVREAYLFALVLGVTDGIFTALTLAAGRVVDSPAPMELTFAIRIAVASSLSGLFVFFAADYSRLRGELTRAERHLNLLPRGKLVTTRLGRSVLVDALLAALISSTGSFCGALFPLLVTAILGEPSFMAIVAAILALGVLGAGVARAVYGNRLGWAASFMLVGMILTAAGMALRIT